MSRRCHHRHPVGLLLLVADVRSGDIPAQRALAIVVGATISTALAGDPRVSAIGVYERRHFGLWILVGAIAAWSIGRHVRPSTHRLLVVAVLGALGLGALVGLLQMTVGIPGGPFYVFGSRARGMSSHPVYFGALMAGAAAYLVAAVAGHRRRGLTLAGIALFAALVNLSGTRVAVAGLLFVVVVTLAIRRDRWTSLGVGAVLAGTAVSSFVPELARALGSDSGAAGRVGVERVAAGVSFSGRTDWWAYGFEAFLDKPILGWGPGQFLIATQGRLDADTSRRLMSTPDAQTWFDPHNIVVTLLVSLGAVGIVAVLGWVVVCAELHEVRSWRSR